MKKITLLFLLLIVSGGMFAQPGSSCNVAMNISNLNFCYDLQFSGNDFWAVFNASTARQTIYASAIQSPGSPSSPFVPLLQSISLYSGSCNSPVLIATRNINNNQQLVITANNLSIGATYFVKITRNTNKTLSFSLCFKNQNPAPPSSSCELICNGRFEQINQCVSAPSQMYKTDCWNKYDDDQDTTTPEIDLIALYPQMGTPDYFNSFYCSNGHPISMNVPNNYMSTIPVNSYPTGNGYSGIYAAYFQLVQPYGGPYREYMQQTLTKPLQAKRQYKVKFAVRLANKSRYAAKLGVLFMNDTLSQKPNGLVYQYQVPQFTTPNFITASNAWDSVVFNFTVPPNINYTHIAIGNFLDDNLSNLNVVNPNAYIIMPNSPTFNIPYDSVHISCYYLDDISIVPSDTLKIKPNPVCHQTGKADTIVAFLPNDSGAVFSWTSNPSDPTLANYANSATIIVNPTTTTTYVVTVKDIYGCIYTDSVKVRMPPRAKITGPNSICVNDTLSYVVDSCLALPYAYSWTAVNGTIIGSNTGCMVTVDWMAAQAGTGGQIIVFVRDTVTGCKNSDTLVVDKCCTIAPQPSCTNPNFYNTNIVTANATQCPGFFTVSGGIYNAIGQMFSINGTFTLDSGSVWRDCIVLLGPKAKIIVNKVLLLDHCHLYGCNPVWSGIFVNPTASFTSSKNTLIQDADSAVVSTGGGLYNITETVFNKNFKDIVVEPYPAPFSGKVVQTTFTCRQLPFNNSIFNWPTEAQVAADCQANAFTFNNVYPDTNLLLPYSSLSHTEIGIELTGVNNTTPVRIGQPSNGKENVFDNITNGIISVRSNSFIQNNFFIKHYNNGIRAVGDPKICKSCTPNFTFVGGPGAFQPCSFENIGNTGIVAEQDMSLRSHTNHFFKMRLYCVEIKFAGHNNFAQITNNFMNDFYGGVHMLLNPSLLALIGGNTIDDLNRKGIGIHLQEFSPVNGPAYIVSGNFITNVVKGIISENVKGADINTNTIRIKQNTGSLTSTGIVLINNLDAAVDINDIKPVAGPLNNTIYGGIHAVQSPNSSITCNKTTDLGFGIRCAGVMPSQVLDNLFTNHIYGFWLSDGGLVGPQFWPTISRGPSYNQWSGTFTGFRCFSSNLSNVANTDTIYWRTPVPSYNPAPSNWDGFGNGNPVWTTATTNGSPSAPACTSAGGGALLRMAHPIAQNSIGFIGANASAQRFMSRQALFFKLINDTVNIAGDTVLSQFITISNAAPLGTIFSVSNTLNLPSPVSTAALTGAKNSNAAMTTASIVEANHKLVNDIYLNYKLNGSFSQQDVNNLHYLASLCPFSDGVAVHQARALLALVDPPGTQYTSVCENGQNLYRQGNFDSGNTNSQIIVYPNPAAAEINFAYALESENTLELEIFNLVGEKVYSQQLPAGQNLVTVAAGNLPDGIYIYKILSGNALIKAGKFIISR